jgi:hypothetical protein
MSDLKKLFLKMQLNIWQNRSLAFKSLSFQKKHICICDLKNQIFYVFKLQFLKTQFLDDLRSAIWFKIVFIICKITILNVP